MIKKIMTALIALGVSCGAAFSQDGPADNTLFELRVYHAEPGKLDDLLTRFRDHTVGLFEKSGMSNLSYFNLAAGQPDIDKTLLYFIAHKNADSAAKSWDDFRKDPVWEAAKKASEEKAGGSLTIPDGVKSVYLKPTDFSPLK